MSQAEKIIVDDLSLEADFYDNPCAQAILVRITIGGTGGVA